MRPDLTGLPVVLSRVAEDVLLLEGHTVVLPQHSVQAEAVIAAELVACTLGQRSRPLLYDSNWLARRQQDRLNRRAR